MLPKIFTQDELILIDSDPEAVKLWIAQHQAQDEAEHLIGDDENMDGDQTVHSGDVESQLDDSPQKPRRRVKRVKTMSCPTGALMFSEEPSALGPQLKPQMIVSNNAGMFMMNEIKENDGNNSLESLDLTKSESNSKKKRSRPSREERRTLSCPVPNMFFQVELLKPGSQLEHELPTLNESMHSRISG